jgi:hypothetical protein
MNESSSQAGSRGVCNYIIYTAAAECMNATGVHDLKRLHLSNNGAEFLYFLEMKKVFSLPKSWMKDALDPQLGDGEKKCSVRVSFDPNLEHEPFRTNLELNFWGEVIPLFDPLRQAESAI